MAQPRRPRPRTTGLRNTESGAWNPYGGSSIGVIARREAGAGAILSRESVERMVARSPLRLLSSLVDSHPALGLAVWNVLRLACIPGELRVVAQGVDGQVDEAATARLDELWEILPSEIGGLHGLQVQLTQEALLKGLICVEAVPAGRGKGIYQIWAVDSLTIGFQRSQQTGLLEARQKQRSGWVDLDPETFFWRAIDALVDEPYGRAPYATAVGEVLLDSAMIQDLRDAIHNAAWPRLGHAFNFTEAYKTASEVYSLSAVDAAEWVDKRFQEVLEHIGALQPDDNVAYDAQGDLKVIEGGQAFRAIDSALKYLRQRMTQSLKSLPTLMGINDGSTQTYTTVEWQIYAAGLESLRDAVVSLIVKCASLHLRLLGLPHKAVAEVDSIRTTDYLIEAQAEGLRIENARKKVRLGWTSHEEAAVEITGTGPVGEPMPGAYDNSAPANPDASKA